MNDMTKASGKKIWGIQLVLLGLVLAGGLAFTQNPTNTIPDVSNTTRDSAWKYKIKSTFATPEMCNYKTNGIFIVWWDKNFDYSQQAAEVLDTLTEVRTECVETYHMSDPPNPLAGYFYNVYLHNGKDIFKPKKWAMGQGTDANGYPFLTIPIQSAKSGSPGLYHEGLHIFQYKATSPLYKYEGDGKWIIEASANWNAASKHPNDKIDYITASTVTANPQLPMWYTYENRETGDEKNWQRINHLYGMHTFLNYLTDVRHVSPGVILDGFYANTKELPQEYMYNRIGGGKFANLYADYAAHNVGGFQHFPAGVEERSAKELRDYGKSYDIHAVVQTFTNEGTRGRWVRPSKEYVTRGWSYNVYKINNSVAGAYMFQFKGDDKGSTGAPAAFQARIVVRTGKSVRVEPLQMADATEGSGTITVKATDAEVYLVIAATPPFFRGNQAYSYQMLIAASRDAVMK